MNEALSKKIYIEFPCPTEDDNRSDKARVLDGLEEQGISARIPLHTLRELHRLSEDGDWKWTISLSWNGDFWEVVRVEEGNHENEHYGVALDLGSTTVVARLLHMGTGECLAETSAYNHQIAFGTDILTRIFYCKDRPDHLGELRDATLDSIREVMDQLEELSETSREDWISMVISGNTTMIHFLLEMDPFCVFHTPYAVGVTAPGFLSGRELGLSIQGNVFCVPGKSNYLGGDIISGMIATGIPQSEEIQVFFDIGTNGELVIGNKEFLLCGAGAAGPALEGGVVTTGMRASEGAVEGVRIRGGKIFCDVIGGGSARGICGSGIIDLIAELYLNEWVDFKGTFNPEKSSRIHEQNGRCGVEYAPGLMFWQEDMEEFLRTKSAAVTMVEYLLRESGIPKSEIAKFHVAGAFGKHVSVESAVTIGMYPDLERERLCNAGNSSLEGAAEILLHKETLDELDKIIDNMVYIQFGAVEDFVHMMAAAQAIPHTDLEQYPSVQKKRLEYRNFQEEKF